MILLWESDDGPLDPHGHAEAQQRVDEAVRVAEDAGALKGEASPVIPSEDGVAVQAVLPFDPDLGDALARRSSRTCATSPRSTGATQYVTGPGALFADFAAGFSGIDGLLLLAAFGVVLLILLVVYRSPLLPLLVIGTAAMALTVSLAVAYFLAGRGGSTSTARARASPRSWSSARPPTTACCSSPGTGRNCVARNRSTPRCGWR